MFLERRPKTDEEFHPRAMKLISKRKNFLVIAEHEPYFMKAYAMIRKNEKANGTWSDEDERNYKAAEHRVHQTAGGRGSKKSKLVVPAAGNA